MDEERARRIVDAIEAVGPDGAKRVVQFVARELDGLAAQVWAFGMATGSRRAVAVVSQMGAELALCASELYEAERWYAGACLVRQLIEVELLLFLFASDDEEPERWMKASVDDVPCDVLPVGHAEARRGQVPRKRVRHSLRARRPPPSTRPYPIA